MRRTVRVWTGLVFWGALAATAHAQENDPPYKVPDPQTAEIRGQVTLPSGFAAKRYVKITLRNTQSVLSTIYTNRYGEFQIRNLAEGTYYVQAEVQDGSFDPVVHHVALGRGLVARLTMELREKKEPTAVRAGAGVVSAAELQQAVPPAARKEYEQGAKRANKGEYLQAAAHFEKALSIFPDYLIAKNDLGAQYLKLKRLDAAEKLFQFVLERDAKNFNAKFNLGLVRIERQDYAGAMSELRQAMEFDRTRAVARLWMGVALLETGDVPKAETELTKALVMGGSECAAANYHLARIYLSRGDGMEAERAVRSYLRDAPKGEFAADAKRLHQQIQAGLKAQTKK